MSISHSQTVCFGPRPCENAARHLFGGTNDALDRQDRFLLPRQGSKDPRFPSLIAFSHSLGQERTLWRGGRLRRGKPRGCGGPGQNKMTFEALAKPRTSVASIAPACNRRANGKV